jgi:Kdo2-lipid IVA lauroyltransferase/acyltransferase
LYFFMTVFSKFVGLIPESLLALMANTLGLFLFDVLRVRRKLMLANIKIAFPELEVRASQKMARQAMQHMVMTFVEMLWGCTNDIESRVNIRNSEVLIEALTRGKGAYILCTHTGNFEAFAMILSKKIAKVTCPVKRVGANAGLNRFIFDSRAKQGMDAFFRGKKGEGTIAIKRALSENRLAGIMIDQARPGEPRIPLFGKPAKTNTSLGAIWEKYPAPIIAGYCERIGFARHTVHLLPEVIFTSTGDLAADILVRARTLNAVVETVVTSCPSQYWWVHDRWK